MDAGVNFHRTQAQWASGLNVLAGLWVLGTALAVLDHGPVVTNNLLCGIAVIALAAVRFSGAYDQTWVSWLNALVGAWLVVSPWAVTAAPTHDLILSNCIAGGVVAVLGCWSAMATTTEPGAAPST
jgi:hypothetical protein